jgi:hypothetical protein
MDQEQPGGGRQRRHLVERHGNESIRIPNSSE